MLYYNLRHHLALGTLLLCALSSIATATPVIGTPSDAFGNSLALASPYFESGVVKYYIPIDSSAASGIYGIDNGGDYGLSSDHGPTPLGGATLSMYLYFAIADGMKGESLTLWFDDLDLAHLNTPTGFFETITFDETVAGELGGDIGDGYSYTEWNELEALTNVSFGGPIPDNNSDVSITISNLELYDEFLLKLQFTSYDEGLDGYYRNTPEYLSATLNTVEIPEITKIPEPASLYLLAIGSLFLARSKRQSRQPSAIHR